jgi:hypothetical protein
MVITPEIIERTRIEIENFRKHGIIAEYTNEEKKIEESFMETTFTDPTDFQTKFESEKDEMITYLESNGFFQDSKNKSIYLGSFKELRISVDIRNYSVGIESDSNVSNHYFDVLKNRKKSYEEMKKLISIYINEK